MICRSVVSHCEFWQNNASSLHWPWVNVYFMKMEISPSCLPRLFLLSWKSSLGDDMDVYQLQKETLPALMVLLPTISPNSTTGQRAVAFLDVRGQDVEQMVLSIVQTFPGISPSLLTFFLSIPCTDDWMWIIHRLPEANSDLALSWAGSGGHFGQVDSHSTCGPRLHKLTGRVLLLGVRNKWRSSSLKYLK